MSGLWNKGYDVLCLIARTLYNLLRHEKISQKSYEKVWRLCFIALLLHPHSRENAGTKWWNKLLEKKFRNNLEV